MDDECKRELICIICRKNYASKACSKRHEKEMHQKEGQYWYPPVGLVSEGEGNTICAICGHNEPNIDHFLTTHKFRRCYQATEFGVRNRFKRKNQFVKHLQGHDLCEGSLLLIRDLRYAKNKRTYACGYCSEIYLDWTRYQEHLTQHLKVSIILPWDNSMVIEALLSQDFVQGPWQKLSNTCFLDRRPLPRLTWPEKEADDLQSSLEGSQAPGIGEKLAW